MFFEVEAELDFVFRFLLVGSLCSASLRWSSVKSLSFPPGVSASCSLNAMAGFDSSREERRGMVA